MGTLLHLGRPDSRRTPRPRTEPEPLWRETLGRRLRTERQRRGERIADVAGRAGVSPQYLSEVERGRKDPSSEVLSALAGALDLTVSEVAQRALAAPGPAPRQASPTTPRPSSAGRPATGQGSDVHLLAA